MLLRLLRPVVDLRQGEAATVLLMFLYSFLAMAGYNMIKPVTRGLFIERLGAENLPWIQLGAGVVIGLIMQGYTRVIGVAPRRWMIPITLAGIVGAMTAFYAAFVGLPGSRPVAALFYLFGLIAGILLISQFWTLANDVYNPRQAKRIFGFIGAGSSLGGFAGAALTSTAVAQIGTTAVLLVSAATLAACTLTVAVVVRREPGAGRGTTDGTDEAGVAGAEAWRLLRSSRHLRTIALLIGFAAIGAATIEQQLNMAAAEAKGASNVDAVTAFLAQITAYLSLIGFLVQLLLTSRIHRYLGLGFALLILPVVDSATGLLMLVNGALWTAGFARVMDTSLRYTVDKTTREILFLPLPIDVKYRAKPFIDVTVDRVVKGLGALMLLVLVQDWGLDLTWRQLSYASVTLMACWGAFAISARLEYLRAFRRNLEQQDVRPSEIRIEAVDLSSVETLVRELAHPDPGRVLYAMDLLDALGKRDLVTPLILGHDSAEVRTQALQLAGRLDPSDAERWLPGVERALGDSSGAVRLAAARALATFRGREAADVMRPYLDHGDPNMVVTAAAALASSAEPADVARAEDTLKRLSADTRESAGEVRYQAARALGLVGNPRFRPLLVPLLYDSSPRVAQAALVSAGTIAGSDFLYVPTLVALMRNRHLKASARRVLVQYGEAVVPTLAYILADPDEAIGVRRHVPSTLASIPCQASVQALLSALDVPDGFLRYRAITALERIRHDHPELAIDRPTIDRQVLAEAGRAFGALTLHANLTASQSVDPACLLLRVLEEKRQRAMHRLFQLLGLVHSPADMAAVQGGLASSDPRQRSGAAELLDNVLAGDIRRRVMLLVEDMPVDERVRKGNLLYRTRTRDVDDTLAQLVHDENTVVAAAAILLAVARGLGPFTHDVEHVLSRGQAQDAAVEAAAWALETSRLPSNEKPTSWHARLPAVVLVDRLRHVPVFDFTPVDELFGIAALGQQVRHERGRIIHEQGLVPATLQIVLEGRVEQTTAGGSTAVESLAPLAFEEILEGRALHAAMRAAEPSICLSLSSEAFLSLLAEQVELAQGILRWLIGGHATLQDQVLLPGTIPAAIERQVKTGLPPIECALLLKASPLFSLASATELLRLATRARPLEFKTGADPLAGVTRSMVVLLTGTVRITRSDGWSATAGAGDVVGLYQILSDSPLGVSLEAISDGTALRFTRADVYDVLVDDIALLQSVFSGLLRQAGRSPSGPGRQALEPHEQPT